MEPSKEDSVLLEKQDEIVPPDYTDDEKAYLGAVVKRLVTARNIRENRHDEFDGMTYFQYCEANRRAANSFIEPKKNREDTNLVTGTTRNKIMAYLALLNNMNFLAEVRAFDQDNHEDVELGLAFEDTIAKTDQLDNDDEKKLLRQYTLLEQGTVFWEEVWNEKWETFKDEEVAFNGSNISGAKWTTRLKKVADGPGRNILMNENVFLGDITEFDMDKQPFIFTVRYLARSQAEAMYGDWERWENVSRSAKYLDQPPIDTLYNGNFTITEVQKDMVEEIKYQDRFGNEFAIFLNGTLMTPVGLPIPRRWGNTVKYNVEKQVLEYVPFFAYGRSLPQRMKTQQQILDELMRLMVLKTQQSAATPRGNLTGMQLSSRIFMPGKFTSGVDPKKIPPLIENPGMNRSELMMIQELQRNIDDSTVSPALMGKNPVGVSRMTATQSNQLKNSAELITQLVVFAATMMEVKAGTLRLYNVLENWMLPIGTKDVNGILTAKYRSINLDKMIEGEGPGQSIVEVTDQLESPQKIMFREMQLENKTGKPTRIRQLNPQAIDAARYSFYVVVTPKQKKTSDLAKVLFNEMMQAATTYFPQSLNLQYLEEEFALVWGRNPMKMFQKLQPQDPNNPDDPAAQNGGKPGAPAQTGAPATKVPGARGSVFPKSMTQAGKPTRPSVNTLNGANQ